MKGAVEYAYVSLTSFDRREPGLENYVRNTTPVSTPLLLDTFHLLFLLIPLLVRIFFK